MKLSFKQLERCIEMSREEIINKIKPDREIWIKENAESEKHHVLAWKNNNAPVLAVVHIDTVVQETEFAIGRKRIFASKLDDRLGLFTILHHLPTHFGINLDILIADNEEAGISTAFFWEKVVDKEYNWIVEFDRPGTDNVCYQFTSPDWCELWETEGFKFGIGSYTDITEMDTIGVKGINIGVGYYDSHSINGFMIPSFYIKAMKRFANFYGKYKSVRFDHQPVGQWNDQEAARDYNFRFWLNDMIREKHIKPTQINSLARLHKWYLANIGVENEASS